MNLVAVVEGLLKSSGYAVMTWQQLVTLILSFTLMYLAIVRQFEPLLLLPISSGIFMSNLPHSGILECFYQLGHWYDAGILDVIYMSIKSNSFPCMMFLAAGATTGFGPLITSPTSLLLDAAAQLGIYCALIFASATGFFVPRQVTAIGVIGGADDPTVIYVANNLVPELVVPIAVAAYSYMVLIPLIQPLITNLLTTDKECRIKTKQLRKVSKVEKIVFPILVVCLVPLLLPNVAPLLYMPILGNLLCEYGMIERLSDITQNTFRNICTISLGLSVGAMACGGLSLRPQTLVVVVMSLTAFSFSTSGGMVFGKALYVVTGGKINPLIGLTGVSAVPMAARVFRTVGSKTGGTNLLLMHAMGPNAADVIGFAAATEFLLTFFTHRVVLRQKQRQYR